MIPSPPPAPLRLIESSRVSPPQGSVPDSSLPLTFFDLIWINLDPVERVFFYHVPHLNTSDFIETDLPNLKSSLSVTLRQFYPLAGKIRRVPGYSEDRHEIHYVDGDSVAFTVAECIDEDFDELSGSHARDVCRFPRLVPQLSKPNDVQPLLAIQVTLYPSQGVAIGITLQHAACDGSSSMHFMSSWASRCRSRGSASLLVPSPTLDRTLIPDPRGLYSIFSKDISRSLESGAVLLGAHTAHSKKVVASFTLDVDQIRKLKDLVMAKTEPGEGHASALRCSSISVAFAYAWVCLVKAREYESERNCHFGFAGNCRSGLRPPLPAEYFGNCIGGIVVEVRAGDLIGEEGFTVAARAVCQSIKLFKSDVMHDADRWIKRFMSIIPHQPLSVAGSPHLKVYGLDFGWGKPKKVEVVSIMRTGAMSVAESRDAVGGLEIGMALPEHEMDAFATHFNSGFESLFR